MCPMTVGCNCRRGEFSYLLQDWDQSLAVESPFAKVDETISKILRFSQSVDSLERSNRKTSAYADEFWQTLSVPPPEEEGELVVASADGKGVSIRGEDAQEQEDDFQAAKDEKAGKKRMALVGSVYTVDRHEWSAEEVLEALFRGKSKKPVEKSSRPQPQHKRVRASLLRDEANTSNPSVREIFGWVGEEVQSRNPHEEKPTIVLMDGQKSLWDAAREYVEQDKKPVEILDLLHATSYVWDAAYLFHGKGSQEAVVFAKDGIRRLLQGEGASVVRGLRWKGTHRRLKKKKRKKLQKICTYLENNAHRMRYNEYLALGYPIASGVIEGACRYVVKDRMERTGMRWVLKGAGSMLALRSVYSSGLWDEFTQFRMKRECSRLYPSDRTDRIAS